MGFGFCGGQMPKVWQHVSHVILAYSHLFKNTRKKVHHYYTIYYLIGWYTFRFRCCRVVCSHLSGTSSRVQGSVLYILKNFNYLSLGFGNVN